MISLAALLDIFEKPYSKGDTTYVRGRGACLVSLAAGSPCPGFCMDVMGVTNEIKFRGGTGAGPPPVYHGARLSLGTPDR